MRSLLDVQTSYRLHIFVHPAYRIVTAQVLLSLISLALPKL